MEIPNEIQKWFDCNLLHIKVPKLTGKKIWNENEKKWEYEIVHICKERCHKE